AVVQPCDVADAASVRELFQRVFKDFKRLDTLVANAGVMDDALIGMVTPELIERVFSTNTYGLLHCAQYASRLMARSGGGSIVALSSIVGQRGHAGQSVYAGSKAAVLGIVASLAKELAPQRIRVNAVAPGFIDTELTRQLPATRREQVVAGIGLGRAGTPQDVAATVLYLASDLARYVTGQVIGVDGGLQL
ncbi:SDR family NAD(P)-dependent oxidoreductase, partial [Aquabacterium sp.]|uniref:SDR family NAD(P)-dependent oxidoreductase n=1 Tax=Aquabacterium sp. TaxID=1872578 RepID=UPI002BF2CDA2